MRIIGLDLSLTATGICCLQTDPPDRSLHVVKVKTRGEQRLHDILVQLTRTIRPFDPQLVVLEDYPSQAKYQGHQMGELHGVVKLWFFEKGIPLVKVNQSVLKGFATGRGNAPKDEVFAEAIRRLDYRGSDNNEADAFWLATMAAVWFGLPGPDLPAKQVEWASRPGWPALDELQLTKDM